MTSLTKAVKLILITFITLNITFGQQPATAPTDPIYDACWKIESDPPCFDTYYANNLGCHWDSFDTSCMCRIQNDNINVIYLVDMSLSASPTQSDFANVAALIEDVTDSTLVISQSTTVHNQIILYDTYTQLQSPNIEATTININQFTRTQLNDLPSAILTAIQQFNTLPIKRNVLVIFNGQMQKDYIDDVTEVCPLKATLNDESITVIIVSYTINDISQGGSEISRNLECLVSTDPLKNEAYNNVSYSAILGAAVEGWDESPIEAKLSWDICNAAFETTPPTTAQPTTAHPTPIPSNNPTYTGMTCGDEFDDLWIPSIGNVWIAINIPFDTETVVFSTCYDRTDFDTILELYDVTQSNLIGSDDDGCGSFVGRSELIISGLHAGTYFLVLSSKIGPSIEGTWKLMVICDTATPTGQPTTDQPTTAKPSLEPTPEPTTKPSVSPTTSILPTDNPSISPTDNPSASPTVCGNNKNSGPGKEIQCQSDDDCCAGFSCRTKEGPKKGKCGRDKKRSSAYMHLSQFGSVATSMHSEDNMFNYIIISGIILSMSINICFVMWCCINKRNAKIYNKVSFDANDSESV